MVPALGLGTLVAAIAYVVGALMGMPLIGALALAALMGAATGTCAAVALKLARES